MIDIVITGGSESEPWARMLTPACGAASDEQTARVALSFSDNLPPPAPPTRDASGIYQLLERDFCMAVSGDTVDIIARPGAPVPPVAHRHLIAALSGPLGLTVLHGAAVEVNGNALLFCGRSGSGKTTISRKLLAESTTLIDDELNFVARSGVGPCVLDTRDTSAAFTALATGPGSSAWPPLAGLFHLKHAQECSLRDLPAAEAAAALLTVPLLDTSPETIDACTERLAVILRRLPARELSFSLDAAALREVLGV